MKRDKLSEKSVLEHFLFNGRSSIPALSRWCGISPTTSLGIVRRLVAKGLLVRGREVAGSRGRSVITYRPRLPKPLLVCLFDGTELVGTLVECHLEMRGYQSQWISGTQTKEQAIEAIDKICKSILSKTETRADSLAGLALIINAVEIGGQCLVSSVLPWVDNHLEEALYDRLGLETRIIQTPVRVIAEYQRRVMLNYTAPASIVVLNVADGVSAETMVQGRPLRGHCSLAGELGHITVQPDGPLCGCGRRGCLEALCSGPAIYRQLCEGLKIGGAASQLDAMLLGKASPRAAMENVWQAWRAGDTYTHAVMDSIFDKLGWGLGIVLNMLDPDLIAIHGYVLEGRDVWLEEVIRRAKRWTMHAAKRDNQIEYGVARFDDEVRVAACDYFYPFGKHCVSSFAVQST